MQLRQSSITRPQPCGVLLDVTSFLADSGSSMTAWEPWHAYCLASVLHGLQLRSRVMVLHHHSRHSLVLWELEKAHQR